MPRAPSASCSSTNTARRSPMPAASASPIWCGARYSRSRRLRSMASHDFSVIDYVDLVDRMTDLLNAETALLEDGRPHEIADLQADKKKLAAAVRQTALAIAADPGMLDDGSEYADSDKAELLDAVTAMN